MRRDQYFPHFDYLRIALAATVMLKHDKVISWEPSAHLAVQIFFALSGWLIGGVLISSNRNALPRFFFNRAVRIWVPYYLAVALLIAASALRDPIDSKWMEFIIYKLSMVYNLFGPAQLADHVLSMPLDGSTNHFWSVNAEEQFYLIAPILLVLLAKYGGKSVILWAALGVAAVYIDLYAPIVLGVLAAILSQQWPDIFSSAWFRRTMLLCAAVMLAAILLFPLSYQLTSPLLSIFLVVGLSKLGKKTQFGETIGGISYPLYLNHWIGVFVANFALAPMGLRDSPMRQGIAIALNLLLAWVLYCLVDRPFLAKRAALFSTARGLAALSLGYALLLFGLVYGLSMVAK
jgi:peptidoglycan/LPS O-acetylase OafA/YrhL